MTNKNINGEINKSFSATGVSDTGYTSKGKVLILNGSGTFSINAEVSKDGGATWHVIKTFTASTVENFDWSGKDSIIRFNLTAADTFPVTVDFE